MNALDLLRAAARHRLIVVLCLLLTAAGAVGVWLVVPVTYEAKTQLVLLSPSNQRDDSGGFLQINPFLLAGDNAAQVTASALASIAGSQRFVDEARSRGMTGDPAVEVSTGGGGVVLEVVVVAGAEAAARRDLDVLRAQLTDYLRARQLEAGAPENQLYRMADLLGNNPPERLPAERTKLAAVAFTLGLALTTLAVVLLHGRDRRTAPGPAGGRAARRRAPAAPHNGHPTEDTVGALFTRPGPAPTRDG